MMDNRMAMTMKQKWEEKQLYGRFKPQINNILHEKTWSLLRKVNLTRETELDLIAAQNNTVRTNHNKAVIDKTQQNSKCRLCEDRDETINHVINKCSNLVQKEYKTRHNMVGKVIHWEMYKKFKFHHTKNGICTTLHLSKKMTLINSYGILTYKRITKSWPEDQTL